MILCGWKENGAQVSALPEAGRVQLIRGSSGGCALCVQGAHVGATACTRIHQDWPEQGGKGKLGKGKLGLMQCRRGMQGHSRQMQNRLTGYFYLFQDP